jgi:Trk K+ transport system NAD-binding subunit
LDYDEAFFTLKREYNVILIGVSKQKTGSTDRYLIKNPEHPVSINQGDYLLVICNGKNEPRAAKLFGVEEGIQN